MFEKLNGIPFRKDRIMNPNKHFEKFRPKLRMEAMIKSLLSAASVGFAVAFAVALVTWFLPINGLWPALATLAVVTVVALPIYYCKKYKPTVVSDARRLDSMGLEERMVTMVEFENDDSCMVQFQRRDAQQVLSNVDTAQLRMRISRKMIAVALVFAILASAMTAVTALSSYGLLKGGDQLLEELLPDEPEVYYMVTYIVEEGGYLEGESDQLVLAGENAEPVMVVADEGYVFVEWDDGNPDPSREDTEVTHDLTFTAVFAPLDEGGEDGEGSEGGDSGDPKDGEPGEGEGDGEQEGEDSSSSGGEEPGETTGGKYEEWNQIINGETYYREFLEAYKERLLEQLEENGDELTEEEKAIIEAYINLV